MRILTLGLVLSLSFTTDFPVFAESWVIPSGEVELKMNVGVIRPSATREKVQKVLVAPSLFDTLTNIGQTQFDIRVAEGPADNTISTTQSESKVIIGNIDWGALDKSLTEKGMNELQDIIPGCTSNIGKKVRSRAEAWEYAYDCLRALALANPEQNGLAPIKSFLQSSNSDADAKLYVIEPVLDLDNQELIDSISHALERAGNEVRSTSEVAVSSDAASDCPGSTQAIFAEASPVWPSDTPGWHLDSDHSQLQAAFRAVFPNSDGQPSDVKIAHLDTGYFPCDSMKPRHFVVKDSYTCSEYECKEGGEAGKDVKWPYSPLNSLWHGPGTLSTLAAGEYIYSDASTHVMGGNPNASVFSIKVHDSFIHLDSRAMGQGIEQAVRNGADLITISAGGFPSARLFASVNHAYVNGTPIFAATGDFLAGPLNFFKTPSQVVYPARYSRVMGVTGVTKDHESYGDAPNLFWWVRFGKGYFSNLLSWMIRGNYGPTYVMSQNVIAAYAPNITRSIAEPGRFKAIGDNGPGTSHATPQVAAAASIWIQDNRRALQSITGSQRLWERSEAVYEALSQSTFKCFADYDMEHFGKGVLRAKDALDWTYKSEGQHGYLVRKTSAPGANSVRIPLKIKKKADYDFPGVLDALLSTRIPGINSGVNSDAVIEAFANMLITELTQLALTSDTVQEYLQKLNLCKPLDDCTICTREQISPEAILRELESILNALPEASKTLKSALKSAAATHAPHE